MTRRFFSVSFIFLAVSTDIYARAGGGSGGGSGASGSMKAIADLIGLVVFMLLLWLIHHRAKQSKKQILISGKVDPIWNYGTLCDYVEVAFMRMQYAWSQKDLDLVQDLITDNCKLDLKKRLHHYVFCNEKNVLEEIKIKSIQIIGSEDYQDDGKDSFVAYIYGSMIDYTISGLTGRIIENYKKKKRGFRDLYYFQRHEDIWLLDKIDNRVTISKVYKAKHTIERQPQIE